MKIYDSYSKKTRQFKPSGDKVTMYVCGLTPYDHTHIGHTRTYVAFDTVKRYLRSKGYEVFHIQNITDVDDKIIKRCKETGSNPKVLTETFHREALEAFDRLRIGRADIYPKVTEHIKEIIALVESLVKNEFAYETKTGVYYKVGKFKNYGKLSGQKLDEIRAGARIEVDETKEAPEDFALWKKTNGEIIEFESPFGKGRPGWHIECSAMAGKYAKQTLDIHSGARDLIFPHHENEIAQSEGATGEKFCDFWMHTGFLTVNGEKMAKSLGNFITVADALDKFTPNAVRFFFLQTHYRSPIDYSEERIEASEEAVERIFNSLGLLREKKNGNKKDTEFRKESDGLVEKFYDSVDNDFDTPNAISALFDLVRLINSHVEKKETDGAQLQKLEKEIEKMLDIFGLKVEGGKLDGKEDKLSRIIKELGIKTNGNSEEMLESIIDAREKARKNKDYAKSDRIRARLKEIGIILEDTGGKIRWKIEN